MSRAWSASSGISTSCRVSTTARPTSRPPSRSPARPSATDAPGHVHPHASFVDVAEIPSGRASCRLALAAGRRRPRRPRRRQLACTTCPSRAAPQLETVAQGPPGRRWLLLEAPLPGTGTLADLARQRAGAARSRLRPAHRPSRALARALAAPGAIEACWPPATACRSTPPRSPATTAPARAPWGSSSWPAGARRHRLGRPSPRLARPRPDRGGRRPAPPRQPAARGQPLVGAAPRALLEYGLGRAARLAASARPPPPAQPWPL